jgi:signal transduction histidine kinase
MDEIVWAVSPRHESLESLAGYLERFAQDLFSVAGIRCRLDLPLQLPAWQMTAEMRHNLFLAFKEALHNVAKHSRASEAHIHLDVKGTYLELVVEDNGCGFVMGTPKTSPSDSSRRFSSGNGLENMAKRLEEIKGRCDIQTAPGQGTRVVFTVPLRTVEP